MTGRKEWAKADKISEWGLGWSRGPERGRGCWGGGEGPKPSDGRSDPHGPPTDRWPRGRAGRLALLALACSASRRPCEAGARSIPTGHMRPGRHRDVQSLCEGQSQDLGCEAGRQTAPRTLICDWCGAPRTGVPEKEKGWVCVYVWKSLPDWRIHNRDCLVVIFKNVFYWKQ